MKVAERTRQMFTRSAIPDRVPIHSWLGLPLIRELKPEEKSMYEMLQWWIDDPMGSIVKMQADLGMDPMITTYSQHIGEHEIWPRMLFPHVYQGAYPVRNYDVTPDGERFLMVRNETPPLENVTELHVVLNWFEELKRRVPTDN